MNENTVKKVMSNLGKSSWDKRVEKYGREKALEMLKEASNKGVEANRKKSSEQAQNS